MERPSDRWVSITLSVLMHGAIVGLLVYGWMMFRSPPRPAPTLAIEATVVDARTLRGTEKPTPEAPPAAAPEPPQPQAAPEPEGPPEPTAEELARRDAARKAQAEAQAQQAAAAKAQAEAAAEARRQDDQKKADAKRKAEEQKKADEQKKAEAAKKAQDDALARQQAQEASDDLKRSIAAEEGARARAGPALASWQAKIAAAITHAWQRPDTARPGIECVLKVTQVPGGQVTNVEIGQCNGDAAVRESIQTAVYRASPLPAPPDPAIFDRNLVINFKPD
ncbi:MAG: cell envelope integrity protein TolA [Proteobacteria bacterium]|nr:cell envelope integrity protein TolA [Pseudomonadota bacterium]